MKYQLVVEVHQLRQEPGQSINDYYDQLRFIWDQIDLSDPTWACLKDAQQYASIRDEFCLYEFLMSLHKDFEPIRGQLLNRSPPPSLDTAVNELQSGDSSGSSNRRKQTNKKFCNYCKRPGHTIKTCYRCNKSTAVVASTEPTPPMASISTESQSSGSTINLSPTELQEIIAQAIRMADNASLSTALSVLPVSSLPSLTFWHSRLGYAPSSRVQQLASKGLLGSVSKENFDYTSCQLGKQPALPFNNNESISNSIFELIHSDLDLSNEISF
ncbi:uncharacterized protein LOC115961644 [Quercus lobata]|uniref:uncharacterized protein LOC115961644 n=1 Tax=Quercus lobata TaxID=97700 RepID=UPI001245E987|nr:uncharacterized protein LOC115961644 [Quercus lobata]